MSREDIGHNVVPVILAVLGDWILEGEQWKESGSSAKLGGIML